MQYNAVHKFVRVLDNPRFSEVFCKCSNALFTSAKAVSEITENGLLSGSEQRKRSTAVLRWISLMNVCKLTVFHLSSSQTYACKNTSEKHSVIFQFSRNPQNILIPNFIFFCLFLLGRNCPQFLVFRLQSVHRICFYLIQFSVDEIWLPTKNFILSDICRINFHIRSNLGIMAGTRDKVNQSES